MEEKIFYSPTLVYSRESDTFEYFPEDPAECVRYVMAKISSRIFLSRKSFSSNIELRARDKELKYIWTGLMAFAKRYPDLKINYKNIHLKSSITSTFDPEKEWAGFFSKDFTKNSFYEEVFKHHLTEEMYEIKEFPIAYSDIPAERQYRTVERQELFKLRQNQKSIEKKQKKIKKLKELAGGIRFEHLSAEPEEPAKAVRYVMACISRYIFANKRLADLAEIKCEFPEKISFRGFNTDAKYIWTAFMIFSKRYPELNIGYKTLILVGSLAYFPEKEWGGFLSKDFTKNSFYEKVFKHHLTEDMCEIQEFPRAFKDVPNEYRTIEEQAKFVSRMEGEKEWAKWQEETRKKEATEREKETRDYLSYAASYGTPHFPNTSDPAYGTLQPPLIDTNLYPSNEKRRKSPRPKTQEHVVSAAPSIDRLITNRLSEEESYPSVRTDDDNPLASSFSFMNAAVENEPITPTIDQLEKSEMSSPSGVSFPGGKSENLTPVSLNWNCFDMAVGLKDRHALVQYASEHAEEEEFRLLLAPEIRHAAALTAIHMNLKAKEEEEMIQRMAELFHIADALKGFEEEKLVNDEIIAALKNKNSLSNTFTLHTLPLSMHTKELQELLNDYLESHEAMRLPVAECNQALERKEGNSLPLEGLDQFFNSEANRHQHAQAYTKYARARRVIYSPHEDKLNAYCQDIEIYKQYINEYYGKQGWFTFQRGFQGEKALTSMIDIAGKYLAQEIHILQEGNHKLEEIYCTASYGKLINIVYRNNDHFVRLETCALVDRRPQTKLVGGEALSLQARAKGELVPFYLLCRRLKAISEGDQEALKWANLANLQYLHSLGILPSPDDLFTAAQNGHLENVVWMLTKGGMDKNQKNNSDQTALHLSVGGGHLAIVQYLIAKGADIHGLVAHGASIHGKAKKSTPLYYAAYYGHLAIMQYLVSNGANINEKDATGHTVLDIAVLKGFLNMVQWLLKNGAFLGSCSIGDNTILHIAAYCGHYEIVEWLLIEGKPNKNRRNKSGQTAFDVAKTAKIKNLLKHFRQSSIPRKSHSTLQLASPEKEQPTLLQNDNQRIQPVLQLQSIEAQRWALDTILTAADKGDLDTLKWAHLVGISLTQKGEDGETLLHAAAAAGQFEVVQYLLENNLSPHDKDNHNSTALHKAAWGDHLAIMKYLVAKGADINGQDNDGLTPLHIVAYSGGEDSLPWLLNMGASVNKQDNDGFTALHLAGRSGRLRIVKCLVENGADLQDQGGGTALNFAIIHRHLEMAQYLLEKDPIEGIRIAAWDLLVAAHKGDLELLKWIQSVGVPLTWKDEDENTPLHHAARGGQLEVVEYLLENNLSPHDKNNHNFTALHEAASGNHLATMKYLVAKGANINEQSDYGTALHLVLVQDYSETLLWLLDSGALVNATVKNIPALHLAIECDRFENVQCLVEHGADLNLQAQDGGTAAFGHAIINRNLEIAQYLFEKDPIEGIKIAAQVLLYAAHEGDLELLKWIQSVGVPLTWKDEDENTPLHHAARGGQLEVVEYLLENNLSPHDKNNHNFTALHEAASGNHLATMKYLVAKGANINEKDGEGFTVLCLAVDQGFFDMVQWLHRNGAFINSSALYLAARYEQLQIVAYLIENTSQEVMQEALYVAIAKDDFIAVKCLVAHDVSIHGKYQGKPLLHCAAYRGDFEIVECLVERGVSPEEKDDENFTALHAAVLGATTEGDPLKIMKYLVAKGTPLDEKSIQGDTALDIAITQGFLEIVLFLLSNGAYIENAILFKAVSAGDSYLNIALSLVSHGASIYEKLEGETLLHCAASLGHFEMAKWLVESGLSLHEKDGKGHTALFQAVQQGYLDVARLLMNIEENSNEKEDADQTAVVLTKTEENALTNLHGPGETKAMTESFADNQNPAPVLRNSALLKLHGAFAYATPRSDTFSFDAMKALLEQEFKEVNSISHIEENAEIQIIFNDKVFCREATEYLYRQFGGPANLDSYEEGMWRLLGEDNDSIAINYTCAQRIVESFSVSSDNKFV